MRKVFIEAKMKMKRKKISICFFFLLFSIFLENLVSFFFLILYITQYYLINNKKHFLFLLLLVWINFRPLKNLYDFKIYVYKKAKIYIREFWDLVSFIHYEFILTFFFIVILMFERNLNRSFLIWISIDSNPMWINFFYSMIILYRHIFFFLN